MLDGNELMMMHKALYLKDDVGRLNVTRKELTSIWKCLDAVILRLEEYTNKRKESLITVANKVKNKKNASTDRKKQEWLN